MAVARLSVAEFLSAGHSCHYSWKMWVQFAVLRFAGKGPYKKHGFARNSDKWKVVRTATEPFPSVVLGLTDDETTLAEYPSKFSLTYSVALESATSISVSMTVSNPGTDPLSFTTALHTYFKVSDIGSTKLLGLGGIKYEDNSLAGGGKEKVQESAEVDFPDEVDRIYTGTPSEAYIVDGDRVPRTVLLFTMAIKVLKMGFADAVVWNIGAERASGLKDLTPGEWKQYVCYEAAAIVNPIKLSPNTSWTAGSTAPPLLLLSSLLAPLFVQLTCHGLLAMRFQSSVARLLPNRTGITRF